MEFLFGKKKTPEEMLKQNQRALNRAMRYNIIVSRLIRFNALFLYLNSSGFLKEDCNLFEEETFHLILTKPSQI